MSRAEELRSSINGSYHWCDVALEAIRVVEKLESDRAALIAIVAEFARARMHDGTYRHAAELIDALPEALRKEVTGG